MSMLRVTTPSILAAKKKAGEYGAYGQDRKNGNPDWRGGNAILGLVGGAAGNVPAGHVIFAEQRLFIQPEITGNGADKAATENSTGKFAPVFVFQSFEKSLRNSCGLGELIQRNFAHLALALQSLPKTALGHKSNLPLSRCEAVVPPV